MSKSNVDDLVEAGSEYHAGFVTDVESETLPPGLDESVVRFISARKGEPQWLTDWRLEAFARWREMREPNWAHVYFLLDAPSAEAAAAFEAADWGADEVAVRGRDLHIRYGDGV